jgi:hypothetical protein
MELGLSSFNKPQSKITVDFIQQRLESHYGNHNYKLSNSYVFGWESDFFSISDTGYVYEFEIKLSRSDFKADFKKSDKHKLFENCKKDKVILNDGSYWITEYKNGERIRTDFTRISIVDPKEKIPNKFFYVCPKGLLDIKEIPRYAGLIEIEDYHVNIVKNAPFLHKNKLELTKILLDKFYYKFLSIVKNGDFYKNENDILKGKIEHLEKELYEYRKRT